MKSDVCDQALLSDNDNGEILLDSGGGRPKKTYSLLFFLLGNSSLLGFNIIINAIDIYVKLTGNNNVGTILNRFYNFPCSITSLLLCIWKPKQYKYLLLSSLTIIVLLLCGMPMAILIKMSDNAVYWVTMILSAFVGIFSACIFSCSFSLASQVSPESSGYVSSGNGCCGVLAAALRVITKAAVKDESKENVASSIYFFLAAIIVLGTLVYLVFIMKDEYVKSKMVPSDEADQPAPAGSSIQTIKHIWVLWAAECLNYMITLSIFPGYLSQTKQKKPWLTWTSVIVTALFCIFDWVGRYLPTHIIFLKETNAWIPIVCRLVFYVIFMISLQGAVNLGEPYWTFLWIIPFAASNGYFGTVAIILGSNHSKLTPEGKRFAGFLMSFAVNAGILLAMCLTFAIPKPKLN